MPGEIIDKLFARLQLIYRHKWTSDIQDVQQFQALRREWQLGLAGIDSRSLWSAVDILKHERRSWPPSIPEFLEVCDRATGLPNATEAWMITCLVKPDGDPAVEWKHPVIYAAASDPRIDLFKLRLYSIERAMNTWRPIYQEYCARWYTGETFEFPVQAKRIENNKGKPVTEQEKEKSKRIAEYWIKIAKEMLT